MATPGKIPGKTFIALPIYGSPDPNFMQAMLMLALQRNEKFVLQTLLGDSCVARARNNLTNAFLQSDCDRLLFIDCDIVFSPEHVLRIASHSEAVVGGFYHAKQVQGVKLICNTLDGVQSIRPDGLQKMKYMGTGFLCIHRTVFDVMINKMGDEIRFHPDETPPETVAYSFWEDNIYTYKDGSRRWLTEDWMFCQRALDCGFDVWGDTQILVEHRGVTGFPTEEQKKILLSVEKPETTAVSEPSQLLPGVPVLGAADQLKPFIAPLDAQTEAKKIMEGMYDIPGLKEPPKRVLDAGANVGLFSFWATQKWPNAEVVAYEAESGNANQCEVNMTGRTLKWSLVKTALYDHNNELTLHVGRNCMCHSVSKELAEGSPFTVPCTDARTIGKFDFVKLDTEGSEVAILSSLDLSETKAVVLEAHTASESDQCLQILGIKGFNTVSDEPSVNGCRLMKFARKEALVS